MQVNQAVQGLHASEADLGEGAAADTDCLTPLGAETQQERENKREMAENWLAVLSVILRAVVHDHAQHATNELAEVDSLPSSVYILPRTNRLRRAKFHTIFPPRPPSGNRVAKQRDHDAGRELGLTGQHLFDVRGVFLCQRAAS